jgi:hypothetical protein
MTSAKVKWKWTPECQEAFDQMKAIMAKENRRDNWSIPMVAKNANTHN